MTSGQQWLLARCQVLHEIWFSSDATLASFNFEGMRKNVPQVFISLILYVGCQLKIVDLFQ